MDTTEVAEKLETRRTEILAQMEIIVEGSAESTAGGISFGKRVGEGTNVAVERMVDVSRHSSLQAELETVDQAKDKLDAGTYGTCDICEGTIDDARLAALPWAGTCMDCS